MSSTFSALEQLKQLTTVVADTGDLQAIRQFVPRDATTNPSLVTAAARLPENRTLIENALKQARAHEATSDPALNAAIEQAIDILTVDLGRQILSVIPGRVSTEVNASLSHDTGATINSGRQLMQMYREAGIAPERILIKIAATWEGIQAARVLEAEGIHCNLTLMFGLHQAQACADAGVQLISPFVGRILDWFKKAENVDEYPVEQDPGVLSVHTIYDYYKSHNIHTEIMGASFRSIAQIRALAGCDLLTISPALLNELAADTRPIEGGLTLPLRRDFVPQPISHEEFASHHQANAMASELLQQGIEGFIRARSELAAYLKEHVAECQVAS